MPLSAGSVWYCELCQVHMWQAGAPKRLCCRWCRKWMTRVKARSPETRQSC